MQQLTGLDAVFLAMETPTVFGHVGSVSILDNGTEDPLTLDELCTHISSRLHLLPPFRRRLVDVPLGLDQPYWVEDAGFDIEFHVRELALPSPGDDEQLAEQVARLHARPLDRGRPLWECYLIQGLSGGRSAMYTKVHHATIDGVSGNEILAALVDLDVDGRPADTRPAWKGENEPSGVDLVVRSMLSLAAQPARAVRLATELLRAVPYALTARQPKASTPQLRGVSNQAEDHLLPQPPLRAPTTPFNHSITAHRRFAFCRLPLADIKPVRAIQPGTTVNDVVMALCAGALRRWLIDHDALPDGPLVAAVPVSVRTTEQQGTLGNRVSVMLAALPTHLADPVERVVAAHEAMRAAKEQHGALPATLLADAAQFATPAVAGLAARMGARLKLLERVSPFNLFISNVPGPNVPLYVAGRRLLGLYPVSAITDGQGLNITVLGLFGHLHFGLLACRELVPDVDRLGEYLTMELDELTKAVATEAG